MHLMNVLQVRRAMHLDGVAHGEVTHPGDLSDRGKSDARDISTKSPRLEPVEKYKEASTWAHLLNNIH